MSTPSDIIIATQDNFESEVLKSTIPVLVDFFATWCGPCKQIAPILGELAQELKGKIKIAKIDVDEEQGLASQYGIRSIPTLMIFINGEVKKTLVGFKSKEDLEEALNNAMGA